MYTLLIVASGAIAVAALAAWAHIRALRDDNRHLHAELADERFRSTVYRNTLADIILMHCPPRTLADARQRATQALRSLEVVK